MPYDLSIIIINWNGGSLLTRCVETIVTSAPQTTYEIVIVDNASEDDSLNQLRASEISAPLIASGQLRIVVNPENRGFGAANNQGFSLTTSRFVFMLNLDTEVRPGTIDRLIEKLNADQTIGACGPRIVNTDGSLQVSVFFSPPRVWHTLLSQLWLYHLIPRRMRGELLLGWHWDHDRERAVPMLGGAAIMARREMIDTCIPKIPSGAGELRIQSGAWYLCRMRSCSTTARRVQTNAGHRLTSCESGCEQDSTSSTSHCRAGK